ncbi:hypothetical protein F5Y19DRAFT_477088 [Xylariaceae sp. FL1651]|nr:hypothetical protein F5Y19DRAFT_477088 [Xylariaceae sp. FL1651]
MLYRLPSTLKLASRYTIFEVTLSYDSSEDLPTLEIVPVQELLSSWRAKSEWIGLTSPPTYEDMTNASTSTLTSYSPGHTRWECEQLAAFIRAKDCSQDGTKNSIVVLAQPNDSMIMHMKSMEQAALMQVGASLITSLAEYTPDEFPLEPNSSVTADNIQKFAVHRDLDVGFAILGALPRLELRGKELLLIVDLSDITSTDDRTPAYLDRLAEVFGSIITTNKGVLQRMNLSGLGVYSHIHGWWGISEKLSVEFHADEPPPEDTPHTTFTK